MDLLWPEREDVVSLRDPEERADAPVDLRRVVLEVDVAVLAPVVPARCKWKSRILGAGAA